MSSPESSPKIIPYADAVPNAVRSMEDLYDVIEQMRRRVPDDADAAVVLPRGTVCPSLMALCQEENRTISSDTVLGALPHTHQQAICLLGLPSTRIPTLIFDLCATVDALRDVLQLPEHRKALMLAGESAEMIERVAAGLSAARLRSRELQVGALRDVAAIVARACMHDHHSMFRIAAETQEALAEFIATVHWPDADAIVFTGSHGRDVRSKYYRSHDEGLINMPIRR